MDDNDRHWSVTEEQYARDNLKLTLVPTETFHKLENTKMGAGSIKGVHCYDILANPTYVAEF